MRRAKDSVRLKSNLRVDTGLESNTRQHERAPKTTTIWAGVYRRYRACCIKNCEVWTKRKMASQETAQCQSWPRAVKWRVRFLKWCSEQVPTSRLVLAARQLEHTANFSTQRHWDNSCRRSFIIFLRRERAWNTSTTQVHRPMSNAHLSPCTNRKSVST